MVGFYPVTHRDYDVFEVGISDHHAPEGCSVRGPKRRANDSGAEMAIGRVGSCQPTVSLSGSLSGSLSQHNRQTRFCLAKYVVYQKLPGWSAFCLRCHMKIMKSNPASCAFSILQKPASGVSFCGPCSQAEWAKTVQAGQGCTSYTEWPKPHSLTK
jgi:hypothetical protein